MLVLRRKKTVTQRVEHQSINQIHRLVTLFLPLIDVCLMGPGAVCQTPSAVKPYDVLIQGGMVYDGSGVAPIRADVALRGDQIVKIGQLSHADATVVLNA